MPSLIKNKKIIIGALSVFLILGFVFVVAAPNAQAGWFDLVAKAGNVVGELLAWAAYFVLWLFSRLIALAAFLLEAVFALEDTTHFTTATVVVTGWTITRGLCNMFFALILLLMAFDTILQTNKFPVKTLLPKLIIVALTINFSLMFLGVFIDFAQILTRFFIDAAAGGADGSIANQLANGLNIAKIFSTPTEGLGTETDIKAALGSGAASLLSIFGTLIFGIIVILIATFAIGAGAIFMLIRLVSLWVLLIMAPLAWLGMITPFPGLNTVTGDWWKKFFQWTFFAPIYAFFIYLAVLVANSSIFTVSQSAAQKKAFDSVFLNNFLSGNRGINLLLQYVAIVIILLTGLKTAQSAGIAGANAVIGWGKKMGDKLKSGAKRWSGAQWAYDAGASKVTKWAGEALEDTRFGRRLRAKGVGLETAGAAREQNKNYANYLKTMSDMDLLEEIKHAHGIKKLLATREAKERGLLERTSDKSAITRAHAIFGAYGVKDKEGPDGRTKEQKDLEDVRFDIIKDASEREKVIRRSKENGNLDKLKAEVLKSEEAMNSLVKELNPAEFTETYKKWGKKVKEMAETTMLTTFKESIEGDEIKKREYFAATTGKLGMAFSKNNQKFIDKDGKAILDAKVTEGDLNEERLAAYVGKMTSSQIADIRHQNSANDLAFAGQHASADLVEKIGREKTMSTEQRMAFKGGVEKGVDDIAKEAVKNSPGWEASKQRARRPAGFNQS